MSPPVSPEPAPGWGRDNAPRHWRPLGSRLPRFENTGRGAGQLNPLLRAFHTQGRR